MTMYSGAFSRPGINRPATNPNIRIKLKFFSIVFFIFIGLFLIIFGQSLRQYPAHADGVNGIC
jgi:hypothetical protein